MPRITKAIHIEITPSQFIENCDETELFELILLSNAKLDRVEKNLDNSEIGLKSVWDELGSYRNNIKDTES
jgi:hypothetical protein